MGRYSYHTPGAQAFRRSTSPTSAASASGSRSVCSTRAARPTHRCRTTLEQEDAGDYSNEAELREITRRFLPIYFASFDERAEKYLDECITPERPNPDALKLFNEGIAEWDMRPELAGIAAPTLVITGAYDFICGPVCAEDIAAAVAGSTKILLEDCGHFAFIEQSDAFRQAVASFLT